MVPPSSALLIFLPFVISDAGAARFEQLELDGAVALRPKLHRVALIHFRFS